MSGRKKVDRAIGPKAGAMGTVITGWAHGWSLRESDASNSSWATVRPSSSRESVVRLNLGETLCFTGQCSAVVPRKFAAVRSNGQVVWLDIEKVRNHVWVEGWRVPWQRFDRSWQDKPVCKI